MVNKAKSSYFMEKLEENKHKSKLIWQAIKDLGMPSKKSKSASIGLKIKDVLCFGPFNVACEFHNFFTNNASSLVDKLPKSQGQLSENFVQNLQKRET